MTLKTFFHAFLCYLAIGNIAQASFLPPNTLHLQDNPNLVANISEDEFNNIIERVLNIYRPLAKRVHGAELNSNSYWSSGTVNASAMQYGTDWQINMYGGLARRPEVTHDGFALVVCHEVGHHFGGFPLYDDEERTWAATEGQADYFATHACGRLLWGNDLEENAKFRASVNQYAKNKCDESWTKPEEQNLCYRLVMAGQSLAHLLHAISRTTSVPVPRFETPDQERAAVTNSSHPGAQCRLDTYLAGSVCTITFNHELIPGKSEPEGQASIQAEESASQYSCSEAGGFLLGIRPRCWFHPQLEFLGIRFSAVSVLDSSGNKVTNLAPGESYSLDTWLTNASSLVTEDVKASLAVSPALTTQRSHARVGNLRPRENKTTEQPLTFKVKETAECGRRADITVTASGRVALRETATRHIQQILVGRVVDVFLGENSTRLDIPDENERGVSSEIVSTEAVKVFAAKLLLHFKHAYPSDLRADLTAPGGLKKAVQLNPPYDEAEEFKLKATVPFEGGIDAQGTWKLTVMDVEEEDIGSLLSWSLTTERGECR